MTLRRTPVCYSPVDFNGTDLPVQSSSNSLKNCPVDFKRLDNLIEALVQSWKQVHMKARNAGEHRDLPPLLFKSESQRGACLQVEYTLFACTESSKFDIIAVAVQA
jgi:hypothetical protein